jgi:ornithine decarboxylase
LASTGSEGVGAQPAQYKEAIDCCKELFQYGEELGFNFTILDIGGGFPESKQQFREMAADVSVYLSDFAKKYPETEMIAEPGML